MGDTLEARYESLYPGIGCLGMGDEMLNGEKKEY